MLSELWNLINYFDFRRS